MASLVLLIVVALGTFFLADSILTPLILLLWTKGWLLALKAQALFTKKNLLQALVQSLVLTGKALFRLVNKTITVWILPLLLTRRQRYWLHHALLDMRRWMRFRLLRGWVSWRRQSLWLRIATLLPTILLTAALFVASGFLLAALFGVSFIVPWLGGLPIATVVFLRRQLARIALYVFERMGLGLVVNKAVDRVIDLVWWRTPEPMQRRFDAWWRWSKMRLRRWVIGPRRKVVKRMADFRNRSGASPTPPTESKRSGHVSVTADLPTDDQAPPSA